MISGNLERIMGSLILISCSDKKRECGRYPVGSDPFLWPADPGLLTAAFLFTSSVSDKRLILKMNDLLSAGGYGERTSYE